MIQRLQSIYLFIVTILGVMKLSFPLVKTNEVSNNSILKDSIYEAADNFILFGMIALIAIVAFVNIFLFKARKVQIFINKILVLVAFGSLGFIGYHLFGFFNENINLKLQPALFFLLVMIFGLALANGRIRKDEKLVKSMDSLR